MPLSYKITDGLLRYTAQGDVEFAEGLEVLQAGLREVVETRVGVPTPVLFDIRASSESRGSDELRGIAAVLGAHSEAVGGRCAVVAAPGLYYGVSRIFSVFVEQHGIEMQIFVSPTEAEMWLIEGEIDG